MPCIPKRIKQTIWSVLGACLVGYFVYHTVQGDKGWLSMMHLQRAVLTAQDNLVQIRKEREELEHRVQLMRPNTLDPDLLEEKSRELLNLSKPNDIIILTPPDSAQSTKADHK